MSAEGMRTLRELAWIILLGLLVGMVLGGYVLVDLWADGDLEQQPCAAGAGRQATNGADT